MGPVHCASIRQMSPASSVPLSVSMSVSAPVSVPVSVVSDEHQAWSSSLKSAQSRVPSHRRRPGAQLSLQMKSAASNYGLIPVSSGGYRLFLGRNAGMVASLGLQNGDIILSVNGISLNSQQDVEQAFAKILAGERLNLLINRGGQDINLSPDISAILSEVR